MATKWIKGYGGLPQYVRFSHISTFSIDRDSLRDNNDAIVRDAEGLTVFGYVVMARVRDMYIQVSEIFPTKKEAEEALKELVR